MPKPPSYCWRSASISGLATYRESGRAQRIYFSGFDFRISNCIASLAGSVDTTGLVDTISTIRGLPESRGGLNIPVYHSSVHRAQGLMASRALIAAFVEENAPWLVVVTREVEERPTLVRWFQNSFTLNPIHAAGFEGKEKPHEIRAVAFGCLAKAIRGQLKADGLRSEERWLASSSYPGSARWVYWLGGVHHRHLWREREKRF